MAILILGLVLFLGVHSARIVADGARSRFIAARGKLAWKGLYAVGSALGLAGVIWGYAAARAQPLVLWAPLPGARHLAIALTLLAFILMVATYVPGNSLKARLHHPMVLSVKAWALAHLLANNTLAALVLFGSFLLWSVLSYRSARQRDLAAGTVYACGRLAATLATVALGCAAWALVALWVHGAWLGIRPLG